MLGLRVLLAAAVIVASFLLAGYVFREQLLVFIGWLGRLRGAAGPFVFALLFLLVSLPMFWGYLVLNFTAAYLYGFWKGLVVNVAGGVLGSVVAHYVCRTMFRSYVQRLALQNEQLAALLQVVEGRQAFRIVALARLTPIPFGLQNGLFSVRPDAPLRRPAGPPPLTDRPRPAARRCRRSNCSST